MAEHLKSPEDLTPPTGEPERPLDAGSQALSEALRSSFGIVKFVMVALVLVFLGSGFFVVEQQQRAIILRFGKPVGEGERALRTPGLQFSFPYPIDDHIKVSITGIQKVTSTVGWYATTRAQEMAGTEPEVFPGTPLNPAVDGYVLTADGNIIHSRATLTYYIKDPVRHVFNFVNASNAVQNAVDNALLYAASRFKVDDILTRDVAGFQEAVGKRATELVRNRDLGVVVEQCIVRSVRPRQLAKAFADVTTAEVTRNKVLNEARSYENQVLSKASADAESRINTARTERANLVKDVSSQAERFNELLPKYRANPSLFVQKALLETLSSLYTNVQEKIFVTEGTPGVPKELWLQFSREQPKPKTEEQK